MDNFDLFGFQKRKKLDKDSERFISLACLIPEDDIRLVLEDTWISFGELQSRISIYCYKLPTLVFLCPSKVAHKILCAL